MSVLILLLCVSAQSVRTLQYVLVTVLGLSVITITVSMISVTLLGTVGVYFFQLIGESEILEFNFIYFNLSNY